MGNSLLSMAKAVVGKNDFLFLTNDSNNLKAQISQPVPLPAATYTAWKNALDYRIDFCRHEAEATYYLFIAPNKHCVYSEFLPEEFTVSEHRIARGLQAISPNVFYPADLLRQRKQEQLQYFKTDTHWTSVGCMNAWNELSKIAKLGVIIDTESTKQKQMFGDLGSKLSPPVQSQYPQITYTPTSTLVWTNRLDNRGRISVFKNPSSRATQKKRGLIFGDSFSAIHLSYIADYFSELVFMHTPAFCEDTIRRIRPDVVINCNVERYFDTPGQCYKRVMDVPFVDFFETLKYPRRTLESFVQVQPYKPLCGPAFDKMQQIANECLKLYKDESALSQMRAAVAGAKNGMSKEQLQIFAGAHPVSHVYNALYQLYNRTKDLKNAEQAIKKAIKRFPTSGNYWYLLAFTLKRQKKGFRATRAAKKAITYDPYNPHFWGLLGNIYLARNKFEHAHNAYLKSIELHYALPATHFQLGAVLQKKKQFDNALYHCSIACELAPENRLFKDRLEKIQKIRNARRPN